MSRLPALTGNQLLSVLQQLGFESLRVKGSHHFLRHPTLQGSPGPWPLTVQGPADLVGER